METALYCITEKHFQAETNADLYCFKYFFTLLKCLFTILGSPCSIKLYLFKILYVKFIKKNVGESPFFK